ncbi:hypothetical protein I7I50_05226 [Histoplasma capsulatum G186AR]|uniref:Uncharacterized protein n=1 Tax=Ajellomyces capsulatus TaxID=5037 RepID=A0A8H8D7K9_AJECA|nr:hypothetical protein I7I52_03485 [Histoplasma capsulatum]QSS75929.1 hypothetical protein I7I50_05226 [Histoplasma capsulatum G186AR]
MRAWCSMPSFLFPRRLYCDVTSSLFLFSKYFFHFHPSLQERKHLPSAAPSPLRLSNYWGLVLRSKMRTTEKSLVMFHRTGAIKPTLSVNPNFPPFTSGLMPLLVGELDFCH